MDPEPSQTMQAVHICEQTPLDEPIVTENQSEYLSTCMLSPAQHSSHWVELGSLVFLTLNIMLSPSHHCTTSSISDLYIAMSESFVSRLSIANLIMKLFVYWFLQSFVYNVKRRGELTQPWGAPVRITGITIFPYGRNGTCINQELE